MAAEQIGRKYTYDIDGNMVTAQVTYVGTSDSDVNAQLVADYGDPPTIAGLSKSSMSMDEFDAVAGVYHAKVEFKKFPRRTPQQPGDASRKSLSIGLRSATVRKAIATTAYAPSGETAPDHGTLIGVTQQDGRTTVEGVEWFEKEVRFSRTAILTTTQFSDAYIGTLLGLILKRNNASFLGFSAKQVLLAGVTAQQRGQDDVEITYDFWADANLTSVDVDGITVTTKDAWDYLEVAWADEEDTTANALTAKAKAAYVHRLTSDADFSQLLGI